MQSETHATLTCRDTDSVSMGVIRTAQGEASLRYMPAREQLKSSRCGDRCGMYLRTKTACPIRYCLHCCFIGAQGPAQLQHAVQGLLFPCPATSGPVEYELRGASADSPEQKPNSNFSWRLPCSHILSTCSWDDGPVIAHVGHRLPSGVYGMAKGRGHRAPKK